MIEPRKQILMVLWYLAAPECFRLFFLDCYAGQAGSVDDAHVFRNKFYNEMEKQKIQELETAFWKITNAEESRSLLKKHLTRETFDEIKGLKTERGATLLECINSSVENLKSNIGFYAAEAQAYKKFALIFDPIINEYHDGFELIEKHPEPNYGDLSTLVEDLDTSKKIVKSTRVRVARSLANFPFHPCLKEDYAVIEKTIRGVTEKFKGYLEGQYVPVTDRYEYQKRFPLQGWNFFKTDKYLDDAGASKFFPKYRGVHHNHSMTVFLKVLEEDHLRIFSVDEGGDLKTISQRLFDAVAHVEQHISFAQDSRLGYLNFCPSNLGTGLRASVHVKLVNLGKDVNSLKKTAAQLNLQVRSTTGEHEETDNEMFDISNKRRLGLTELQALTEMQNGILELIRIEKAAM